MRLVGTSEWIVIAVLIAYLAFTPGLPVVRQFLSTGLGKALGLAAVVATWKYVSHPVALLLLVNYVRCSGMREFMDNPPSDSTLPPNTYCPENHTYDNGQCRNNTTGQTTATTVCMTGQTWDGTKCSESSTAPPPATMPPPPAAMPPPPTTSSTTTKQPFTLMSGAPVSGGYQPDINEKENFAPF